MNTTIWILVCTGRLSLPPAHLPTLTHTGRHPETTGTDTHARIHKGPHNQKCNHKYKQMQKQTDTPTCGHTRTHLHTHTQVHTNTGVWSPAFCHTDTHAHTWPQARDWPQTLHTGSQSATGNRQQATGEDSWLQASVIMPLIGQLRPSPENECGSLLSDRPKQQV